MKTESGQSFNLVEQEWLRCMMHDGSVELLSLREVFEQSHKIRQLSGESPQQNYAIFRLLLVILWRAHAKTPEITQSYDLSIWWKNLFTSQDSVSLSGPVIPYLEEHRARFDLLDREVPFMQVADLATSKGEHSGVGRLVPEAEADYFTMKTGRGREKLEFAEAARWLISIQSWDYSGIKPGALGDPRVKSNRGYPIGTGWVGFTGGVVLHGYSLAQTLMLNTVPNFVFDREHVNVDLPVWEREPDTAAPRSSENPAGPCDILTWQSRRVRLFYDHEGVTGVLVSNGDKIEIRNQFADPMTGHRYSSQQSKKSSGPVFFAKSHPEERTLWKGVEALLAQRPTKSAKNDGEPDKKPVTIESLPNLRRDALDKEYQVRVELVGYVYGPQSSVITNSIHEVIPFQLQTLTTGNPRLRIRIVQAASRAVDASVHLGQFAGFLAEAAGSEYKYVPAATERVLNSLESSYKDWILQIDPEADLALALDQWSNTVENRILEEAEALMQAAGTKAMIGRSDPKSDKPRVLNSATAYGRLKNSLNKTLERTINSAESRS